MAYDQRGSVRWNVCWNDLMSKAIAAGLLAVILLAAYSNHFHMSFHIDDAHTIEHNAAIRELRNIPRFFVDATTFSALPSNQSYRPVVTTLFAIDYKLARGVHPFWFHLSIFGLFVALVFLFAFFIDQLIGNRWIALAAAGYYGLHPANADTVNYIIASAEIITALGVVGSFAIYLGVPALRRYYLFVIPAAVAVLAKPPAAIFAVLFALYAWLFSERDASGQRLSLRISEMAFPFVICGAVLFFVQRMTPPSWTAGAASARTYLITQPYVALLYFKTFFWPADLSADYDLAPLSTMDDPRFWAGFAFLAAFLATAIFAARHKKTRVIGFGLLWFLIALLPTSLFPLAEVMNDHRTFLPYLGLVIAIAGVAALWSSRVSLLRPTVKIACTCLVAAFLCANAYATFQRNKVWRTEETLWRDTTVKSPHNGRALMNYGNTLMAKGDFAGALEYFHRAQALVPSYPVLFVNLGIAEGAVGHARLAEQHFKKALRLGPTNPDCYSYYGRWLLSQSRAGEALPLLRKAVELAPADARARDALKQAEESGSDNGTAENPATMVAHSLQLYREGRYEAAIAECHRALAIRPDYAEAWNNIGAALNQLGRYEEAVSACEQALRYKPDFELARNNLQYARSMIGSGKN